MNNFCNIDDSAFSTRSIFALLICLYAAQGLPSGFIAHALPAIMRGNGFSLEWIAWLKILALPWVLKVLWAPYLDRAHRLKASLLLCQMLTIVTLLCLALLPQGFLDAQMIEPYQFVYFCLALLLLNFFAASQDVVTDGLAVRLLAPAQLGWANTIQVSAYKVGMLAGGSGILYCLSVVGLDQAFLALAGAAGCLSLLIWYFIKAAPIGSGAVFPPGRSQLPAQARSNPQSRPQSQAQAELKLLALTRSFLASPYVSVWLPVLLTYKIADSLGSAMIKPMLIDYGWSYASIANITVLGILASFMGAGIGGYLIAKRGAWLGLMYCGIAQALGIGLFVLLPLIDVQWQVTGILMLEALVDGASTVALFAVMMMFCRKQFAGFDYTLQASLQVIIGGILSILSGYIASWFDYAGLFSAAALLGLLPLIALMIHKNSQTWINLRAEQENS